VYVFGPAGGGLTPVTGDWDGNETDGPGLYNPSTGAFFLKNANASGPADFVFSYGPAGVQWVPLAGDWNGDGAASVALYDPAAGAWYLRNMNASGPADTVFVYGPPNASPLGGDWNGL
jgi:hypothetical protein